MRIRQPNFRHAKALVAFALFVAFSAYGIRFATKENGIKPVAITYLDAWYSPHLVRITDPNLETRAPTRRSFDAPYDVSNVALHKPVSVGQPDELVIGSEEMLTDGDKDFAPDSFLHLDAGQQWIQIDLGMEHRLYAIQLWRYGGHTSRAYRDTVVQISSDELFRRDVQTVYNNDHDDSSGLGAGSDKAYIESLDGRLITLSGQRARFVRFWSNGNSAHEFNEYVEAEVYGCPSPLPGL